MKKKLFIVSLCMACMHAHLLWGAGVEIPLNDLYSVMPLDDKESGSIIVDDNPNGNGITASLDGRHLTVKVPAGIGHGKVIITRTDTGIKVADRNMTGTAEHITLNAAGRYMLEVYTDTEAVGGMFEVK